MEYRKRGGKVYFLIVCFSELITLRHYLQPYQKDDKDYHVSEKGLRDTRAFT